MTTAVGEKHTTLYPSGKNSHVSIAPANAAPSDRTASVTCLTTHSKDNIVSPPKLISAFHAPHWCTHSLHSLFLERHKQTSIRLDRKPMAVPPKPNWVNQQLSFRGLEWSYLDAWWLPTPTAKSHPIMDDDLMEATSRSLLSVNLLFLMYSSISQDHLQLRWAVGRSLSWNLREEYCNTSLGCYCIILFRLPV